MKNLRPFFMLASFLCLQAVQAQFTLTLNLQQMDPYIGKSFVARVWEQSSGKEVGRKRMTIESSNASLLLYVFLMNHSYNIDLYVDVNENGEYDVPPADHAWRRTALNVTGNIALDFIPDNNYTDIILPDPFPYSQYNAIWGGKWMNLTFGSTDTIEASMELRCDSILGYFMTKGVFGNPAPLEFNIARARPDEFNLGTDTVPLTFPPPWTGSGYMFNGELFGSFSIATATLNFNGTVGSTQILALYEVLVSGNFLANGFFYLRQLELVSAAPELAIQLNQSTNVSCAGGMDGILSVAGEGGTPDYTYLWSNGQSTPLIVNLPNGTYTVTVTDADGCSIEEAYTITQPSPLVVNLAATDVACFGECTGSVLLGVAGGQPPYSYTWSNGSNLQNPDLLCAGEYTVTVTDANACKDTLTVAIDEPDVPFVIDTVFIEQPMNGQNNGSIEVIIAGGIPPFTYAINGGPSTTSNIFEGLPPGEYCISATDAMGCIIEDYCIELTNITAVSDLSSTLKWYPNPAVTGIQVVYDSPITVEIIDLHGRTFLKTETVQSGNILLENIPAGIYWIRFSDGEHTMVNKLLKQ